MNELEKFDQYCNDIDQQQNKEKTQSLTLAKVLATNHLINKDEVNQYAEKYSPAKLMMMLEINDKN